MCGSDLTMPNLCRFLLNYDRREAVAWLQALNLLFVLKVWGQCWIFKTAEQKLCSAMSVFFPFSAHILLYIKPQ